MEIVFNILLLYLNIDLNCQFSNSNSNIGPDDLKQSGLMNILVFCPDTHPDCDKTKMIPNIYKGDKLNPIKAPN